MENLDWASLGFNYTKTDCNVRCCFRDGKWGALEFSDSEYISMHISAACLHYGLELFESRFFICSAR